MTNIPSPLQIIVEGSLVFILETVKRVNLVRMFILKRQVKTSDQVLSAVRKGGDVSLTLPLKPFLAGLLRQY
jgi:hypothetical protein